MELKGKNVLVTGGAGFIGSHLVDELIKHKPNNIVVVDNMFLGKEKNLINAKKLFPKLQLYKVNASYFDVMKDICVANHINVVFNLAVIPLPVSLENPKWCVDENNEIVTTICELQRLKYFETLIHFSSSEVYGSAKHETMCEKHPLSASTPYAASKAAGDHIVLSYCKTFKTDSAIIRPFNNYGPRQNEGSYAGVIPITIKKLMNGEAPIIFGDGLQTRDFIYVTETAKSAIQIYKNKNTRGQVINIASGKETSILSLIRKIMPAFSCKYSIRFMCERPGDVRKHIADISKAQKVLGFKQLISFDEGLKMTIDWYKKSNGFREKK